MKYTSPLNMNYKELDTLLNSLLKAEGLPNSIDHYSNKLNYTKYSKYRLYLRTIIMGIKSKIFYKTYIKKKLSSTSELSFSKSLIAGFVLFKVTLSKLLKKAGGKFDNKLFANYVMAAMLYDAVCDVPSYKKYLKELDAFIMQNKNIEEKDEFLALAKKYISYIEDNVDDDVFNVFISYMRIEHISQLMSIYQSSDKSLSKKDLFKITLSKGGICILALTHLLAPNMNKNQRRAIYNLGGVLQILEDFLDSGEDLYLGIQTLPNQKMINSQELKQLFIGATNDLIDSFDMDPNRSDITLDIFSRIVLSL